MSLDSAVGDSTGSPRPQQVDPEFCYVEFSDVIADEETRL
jgi:hypothetical protein